MRKIRVSMVVVLAVVFIVPSVVQAQVEAPQWDGGVVAERFIGWIGSLWTAVAGSGTKPPDAGDGTGVVPEGTGIATTWEDPTTEADVYPEFDPDG